jgi:hypothetical protein
MLDGQFPVHRSDGLAAKLPNDPRRSVVETDAQEVLSRAEVVGRVRDSVRRTEDQTITAAASSVPLGITQFNA